MRFIYHQQIPAPGAYALKGADELWQRANDIRLLGETAEARLIGKYEIGVEALAQLLLPLAEQRLGCKDKSAADNAAQGQLFIDKARLDGLTQAHLIRQDRSRRFITQNALDGAELIGEG